jgi:hypothetical protein
MDMREGEDSYLVGFLECEHGHASASQHVRSAVFNESLLRCQVLNHAIFRPAFDLDKISHLTPAGINDTKDGGAARMSTGIDRFTKTKGGPGKLRSRLR